MVERDSVGSGVSWEEEFGYSRAVRVGDDDAAVAGSQSCQIVTGVSGEYDGLVVLPGMSNPPAESVILGDALRQKINQTLTSKGIDTRDDAIRRIRFFQ